MEKADKHPVQQRVPDHDASPEQRLRNQIGLAKEQSNRGRNMLEELRTLRAAHYRRAGADGG